MTVFTVQGVNDCTSLFSNIQEEVGTRMILQALYYGNIFKDMGKKGRIIFRTSDMGVIVLCLHFFQHMFHASEVWVQLGTIS